MSQKVAVISAWDAGSESAWSGAANRLMREIGRYSEIIDFTGISISPSIVDRALARGMGLIGKKYLPGNSVMTANKQSSEVAKLLSDLRVDAVISLAASTLSLKIPKHIPVLQITDATFRLLRDFYPMYSGLGSLVTAQGEYLERKSIQTSNSFMVSSSWAADSLVQDYQVDSNRITVAPFGPRISANEHSTLLAKKAERSLAEFRILTVTSNWIRKGGPDVLNLFRAVKRENPSATLTIVGDGPMTDISGVRWLGQLTPSQLALEYQRADVLVEATIANAGGMTLTDAASFGLPVIARRVGGVESIVKHGSTGYLIDPSQDFSTMGMRYIGNLRNAATWPAMSGNARTNFRQCLSWDAWGKSYVEAVEKLVEA